MKNEAKQKKAYVKPQIEVREGFEKDVLQSGCEFKALTAGCGWLTPTG